MSRNFLSSLWLTPALLGASALAAAAQTPAMPNNPSVTSTEQPGSSTMEQVINYTENTGKTRIGQVTSVSQFSDVKPTDWAFQALQSLVERYGCIVGYPDKTYRGNRALSRWEFAAGLNACLNRVSELIASSTADLVKKEDLDALKRLQEEFAAELAELRGRVDALGVRVATLEKQQFSTTAKLNAEVILAPSFFANNNGILDSYQQRTVDAAGALFGTGRTDARNAFLTNRSLVTATTGAIGGRTFALVGTPGAAVGTFALPVAARPPKDNVILGDRVRLNIDASFSGTDRLRVTLQARNITGFNGVTGTNLARLGFDGSNSGSGGNDFQLRRVEYRFNVGKLTQIFVGGGTNDGLEYNDSIPTLNPFLDSSGQGSISRFGRFNPIYRVTTGTGIIINQKFGGEYSFLNKLNLSVGYLVPTADASDPTADRGLFRGSYSALAQLAYTSPVFSVGLTYANAYYNTGTGLTGSTGTSFANNPFASGNFVPGTGSSLTGVTGPGNIPVSTNNYGVEASVRVAPWLVVSGWGGYTEAEARRSVLSGNGLLIGSGGNFLVGNAFDPIVRKGDKAKIWNWAVAVAFPDLFKRGNVLGFIFGMPPRVTENDFGNSSPFAVSSAALVGAGFLPRRVDNNPTYHVEAFYKFQLNDNLSITPGAFAVINPEGNSRNDTIFVGTLRATFTF
jgi:hypothetical protein